MTQILYYVFSQPNVHPYLDPGTGSIMFQIIISFLVGGPVFFKVFWKRIIWKRITAIFKNKPSTSPEHDKT